MTQTYQFSIVGIEAENVFIDECIAGEVEIEDGRITQIEVTIGEGFPVTLTGDVRKPMPARALWSLMHSWAKTRFAGEIAASGDAADLCGERPVLGNQAGRGICFATN